MDALTLLCNLHADGPVTLQRLRRAGIESIGGLQRIDEAKLVEVLGWNARTAGRFLREAALLGQRVGEEEVSPAAETLELETTLLLELGGERAIAEGEAEAELPPVGEAAEEDFAEALAPPVAPERVEAVLGAWRELDRVTPPADPAEFLIPRPPPPADLDLARAGLGALTPAVEARLADLGVRTVRELLARRELELARALPLAYTRVHHLRFQAERALDGLASSPRPAPAVTEFRAFTPPPSEPFETAGPFA